MEKEEQLTSVEFLESEIPKLVYIAKSNKVKFDELINKAKEMEEDKDQETYSKGYSTGFIDSRKIELEQHKFNDEFQGEQIIDEQDKSAILSIINNNNEKYTK